MQVAARLISSLCVSAEYFNHHMLVCFASPLLCSRNEIAIDDNLKTCLICVSLAGRSAGRSSRWVFGGANEFTRKQSHTGNEACMHSLRIIIIAYTAALLNQL